MLTFNGAPGDSKGTHHLGEWFSLWLPLGKFFRTFSVGTIIVMDFLSFEHYGIEHFLHKSNTNSLLVTCRFTRPRTMVKQPQKRKRKKHLKKFTTV